MEGKIGKIHVVGIGPGEAGMMTGQAREALETCDIIIGYTVYVELVRELFPGKEFATTPMRREEERCRLCFEEASKGRTVAMICSGDPGVYGMSGLMFEIGKDYPQVEVDVIPGVTAALSGAALLGAPLIHDFCLISLSDQLTSWETIEKRLRAACEADFVIVLYNPVSHKRPDHLRRAAAICLESRSGETVCGLTGQIGRDGESVRVMTLRELPDAGADMFTTVFIGNSQTKVIGGRMVTPRGYRAERRDGE